MRAANCHQMLNKALTMSRASTSLDRSTAALRKVSYISAGHGGAAPARTINAGSNRYATKKTKGCGISLISHRSSPDFRDCRSFGAARPNTRKRS